MLFQKDFEWILLFVFDYIHWAAAVSEVLLKSHCCNAMKMKLRKMMFLDKTSIFLFFSIIFKGLILLLLLIGLFAMPGIYSLT